MNIAIILNKGFGADGISAFVLNNYQHFDHNKFHCELVYPLILGDPDIAKKNLILFTQNGDSFQYFPKLNGTIFYFLKLTQFLKAKHFDAVHIHGSSAGVLLEALASKIAHIKTIFIHSHNTTGNHIFIHKICRFILNKIVTDPLACGNAAGIWMYGKKKKFQVIPNGIDLDKYRFNENIRDSIRKQLGIDENCLLVGHVGGFNEQKNQKFLIDFAKIAKEHKINFHMILIGRGHTQESLINYAKSLNLLGHISFLGQRTDVNELMMGMDAFFLPSLFEGFPIVAVEAQASGLPTFMANTIAKETELTDLIRWLPINQGPECWLKALKECKRTRNRSLYADDIAQQGFDIRTSSALLQSLYYKG